MGVVYEAVDERLEKHVAIKVLRDDFARRQDVVARFTQEAKSAARIKHENVLDVTDYGQTEGRQLLHRDGAPRRHRPRRRAPEADGTLGQERGVDMAIQVCRALHAAHQKGIVHRDMKPENVFLVRSDDGREVVKIVDFGIAQMKDISGAPRAAASSPAPG
jgi:serine/threonine protein kinase